MDALEQLPVETKDIGRGRFLACAGRPFLIADWADALFLHFEISPSELQPFVPFELDLRNGRAFVSLVAFTMRGMRFARGGHIGAWICRPMATHRFLNLRTYVRHGGDRGICFLSEWLPNWLSVLLGPLIYALPYRYAAIECVHEGARLHGVVRARGGKFYYEGELSADTFNECADDSLDQFLLERYVAFNAGYFTPSRQNVTRRLFHVWHESWQQKRSDVRILDDTLLRRFAPWWPAARFVSANYSPGVLGVWMSAPRVLAR
jgi:uncharacterized protein YqjF (DUF2071 family)